MFASDMGQLMPVGPRIVIVPTRSTLWTCSTIYDTRSVSRHELSSGDSYVFLPHSTTIAA